MVSAQFSTLVENPTGLEENLGDVVITQSPSKEERGKSEEAPGWAQRIIRRRKLGYKESPVFDSVMGMINPDPGAAIGLQQLMAKTTE